MSGGHFDYNQYRIEDIACEIERLIRNKGVEIWVDEENDSDWEGYSKETLEEFKKATILLRKAGIYAQRIDWLVCGDDGEETFHQRLKEDLLKLNNIMGENND